MVKTLPGGFHARWNALQWERFVFAWRCIGHEHWRSFELAPRLQREREDAERKKRRPRLFKKSLRRFAHPRRSVAPHNFAAPMRELMLALAWHARAIAASVEFQSELWDEAGDALEAAAAVLKRKT